MNATLRYMYDHERNGVKKREKGFCEGKERTEGPRGEAGSQTPSSPPDSYSYIPSDS